MANHQTSSDANRSTVVLPAPTAWPFLLAAGVSLLFTSLVTNVVVAYLGIVLLVISAIGWFRQVLPHDQHEAIEVVPAPMEIVSTRTRVARIHVDETHRAQLPLATYPISSGIIGGLAGGVAMIIPAGLYGLLRFHSLWYTINLLGGMGAFGRNNPTTAEISQFHLTPFLIACVIHICTSLLVGLLYGALLPVWPKRPILLGGIVGPVLWTGFLFNIFNIVNPFYSERISWPWFAVSQLVFGLVAGLTVAKRGRLRRLAQMPLPVRMGVHASGLHGGESENEGGGR